MHEKVIDYYNQCEFDYRWIWGLDRHHAIHYGYYDKEHTKHAQAIINLNRVLAEMAHIGKADHVLDAGCGIGGSVVWLVKNLGCRAMGISIVSRQIRRAKELARQFGVEDLADFKLQDYNLTDFPDGSFSVVWGIESVCYAPDKKKFLAEAWRLLSSGGRIVVADGFLDKKEISQREKGYLDAWLDGWAVPNLAHIEEFQNYLHELGFTNISFSNVTEQVAPSSVRMYWTALLAYPVGKLMQWLGLRNETQTKNVISAYHQRSSLKNHVWSYGIFYAEKP